MKNIKAHSAKIYGIDWAHNSSRELVTCSLDKTIKLWDVDSSPIGPGGFRHSEDSAVILPQGSIYEPYSTIHTSYPVWRARDLPFGNGLLSLPQRGGDALEMWSHSTEMPYSSVPVESFEGHADVVKEFVWRRGGRGQYAVSSLQSLLNRLQIGATSNSLPGRKIRPCDFGELIKTCYKCVPSSHQAVAHTTHVAPKNAGQPPDKALPPRSQGYGDNSFSFRTPPEASHAKPALSAPVGQRGILAEVRAMHFGGRLPNPVLLPLRGTRDQVQPLPESEPEQTPTVTAISVPPRQGGTMTRGNRAARMDALAWLSSVRVGERTHEGSSGTGSGPESRNASRMGSRSRPSSRDLNSVNMSSILRRRSDSRGHWEDESEGQSLQDE